MEDLRWLGLDWDRGPGAGDKGELWVQSKRHAQGVYLRAWEILRDLGLIYSCSKSRKELSACSDRAPEALGGEVIFPKEWRGKLSEGDAMPGERNWRFRVNDAGKAMQVQDGNLGLGVFQPGRDYGDFLVWRRNGFPSYELAVVVDDILMGITEVVRGADLWVSTARQMELYRAFSAATPKFFHCDLVRDAAGNRLAKRAGSLGVRALRESGTSPEAVFRMAEAQF